MEWQKDDSAWRSFIKETFELFPILNMSKGVIVLLAFLGMILSFLLAANMYYQPPQDPEIVIIPILKESPTKRTTCAENNVSRHPGGG